MFDKDGKLDERSRRILGEQTIPPRYGLSPAMTEGPNMTAAEIVEAEKAYFAKKAAERATRPDPLEPVIDRMLEICKEHGSA